MSDRDIQIARLAYRMGRKDSARYAEASVRSAHVDSQTVNKIASLVWASISDSCERDPFEALSQVRQTKLRFIAHRALEMVGAALSRALEEAPPDPVSFEAIVRAVDFDREGKQQEAAEWCEYYIPDTLVNIRKHPEAGTCEGNGWYCCGRCARWAKNERFLAVTIERGKHWPPEEGKL